MSVPHFKPLPPTPPPYGPLPSIPSLTPWEPYEASRECEDDRCPKSDEVVSHCIECGQSYCGFCWVRQGPHRKPRRAYASPPHEPISPSLAERIDVILNPNPHDAKNLHAEDRHTKWIGLARDDSGQIMLEDYGRYYALQSALASKWKKCHPQLVSFVGETNAGKSTLIKMLVTENQETDQCRVPCAAPVTSTVANELEPTSGDIHLYTDPMSAASIRPILFVDCEGLRGGERTPLGARMRWPGSLSSEDRLLSSTYGPVRTRPIAWTQTEEARSRQAVVEMIYPRFLYAFSDCVVFVLRNPKTIEGAVLQLLHWGASALERSINQPVLPRCILVLNHVNTPPDHGWDVDDATRSLLSSMNDALGNANELSHIRRLQHGWRELGHDVCSIEDLLLCYYSSFHVLRVPGRPKYACIDRQVSRLRSIISAGCDSSFAAKAAARAEFSGKELSRVMHSALDHFAAHSQLPFDFMRATRHQSATDVRFHVLRLLKTCAAAADATLGLDQWNDGVGDLFRRLIPMLASAVLLDCARRVRDQSMQARSDYCEKAAEALLEYIELHHPCSGQDPGSNRRCELVKARHRSSGHQDGAGYFRAGGYTSSLKVSMWEAVLWEEVQDLGYQLQIELEQSTSTTAAVTEEAIAWDMHVANLTEFYTTSPSASMHSHATCLSCLLSVPEHLIDCGHALCMACIRSFGSEAGATVHVYRCPLLCSQSPQTRPTLIKHIPPGAGLRVLSLDGGGTRAILQLELLGALQKVLDDLGGRMPICSMFDLIIGAGTGALNAALLDVIAKHDDVRRRFDFICRSLFRNRSAVQSVSSLLGKKRRYPAAPMFDVLKTCFGENTPLFRRRSPHERGTRIAMICPSSDGMTTTVLANYRRPDELCQNEEKTYCFERPHLPEEEPTIWESVARCMADQATAMRIGARTFPTSDDARSAQSLSSIAVAEAGLLAPGIDQLDLLLSVGTGQDTPASGVRRAGARLLKAVCQEKSSADGEVLWSELHEVGLGTAIKRILRFNDNFGKQPFAPDDCRELERVRKCFEDLLYPCSATASSSGASMDARSTRRWLEYLAYRLIATSFYILDESTALSALRGQRTWTLRCRFETGSEEMRSLCRIVRRHSSRTFKPHFIVWPNSDHTDYRLAIPLDIVDDVIIPSRVTIDSDGLDQSLNCSLFLRDDDALAPDGLPVSGVPQRCSPGPKPTTHPSKTRGPLHRVRAHRHSTFSRTTSDRETPGLRDPDPDFARLSCSTQSSLNLTRSAHLRSFQDPSEEGGGGPSPSVEDLLRFCRDLAW